jgi:phosphoribosylformimino-5-aminoimidazole carboxamide ribotide isomerase
LKDFLIPAIDLKEGRLVRLYRGQEDHAKVYSEKPEEVARFFEGLGFSRLHVVDLDGRSSKGFQKNHSSPAVGWQAWRI